MTASSLTDAASDREVSIVRAFDAPRSLVYQAWTTAESLSRWFAPSDCAIEVHEFAFREGGEYLTCIVVPGGYRCWCRGVYRSIVPNERIEFSMVSADSSGNAATPASLGMDPEWPQQTWVAVTFEDDGAGTRLTLHQTVSEALARKTGAYPSWLSMFDKLAAELAKSN